ncbi:uncharacterized protein EAF02_004605 [Botrytis sinoallii]|uniref:uncharacterized protein n=1 Tax=Botrytis sinoallii TaxID=1463999 RepID=UPI0019014E55|nr:uncharacterized protein EAF02_004605 [Botrytis sinoallii]KAF7884269.1 hypothetical protein EAF02_004605 [Botrytis sinoallii]
MSEMQHETDLSGVTHFPELDFTSSILTESDATFGKQHTSTTWECGLLLLAVDWYSGGKSAGLPCLAQWEVENRIAVSSVFCNWAAFLNNENELNGLEPSRVLANGGAYSKAQLVALWHKITKTEFRDHAIATLYRKILPLKEKLEVEFKVKICYLKHEILPGCLNKDHTSHVNDGTLGQYKVEFSRSIKNGPNAERIWQTLDEKRKERERLYDLVLQRTNQIMEPTFTSHPHPLYPAFRGGTKRDQGSSRIQRGRIRKP